MKISFVIPSYNLITWLPHAVTSCLEQTYKDIEVVVVNDGSTDQTSEYLDWLNKNEPRAKGINTGKNIGRSEARNLGNSTAQGEVICVLDADDLSTPNRADIVARKFKSKIDYLYGAATIIDVIGKPISRAGADVFDQEKALKEPFQNRIVHSAASYTNEFSKKYPYRQEMSKLGLDDWAQQIEAKLDGAIFDFVPQLLCAYRMLNSQITKQRDEKEVLEAKKQFLSGLKVPA